MASIKQQFQKTMTDFSAIPTWRYSFGLVAGLMFLLLLGADSRSQLSEIPMPFPDVTGNDWRLEGEASGRTVLRASHPDFDDPVIWLVSGQQVEHLELGLTDPELVFTVGESAIFHETGSTRWPSYEEYKVWDGGQLTSVPAYFHPYFSTDRFYGFGTAAPFLGGAIFNVMAEDVGPGGVWVKGIGEPQRLLEEIPDSITAQDSTAYIGAMKSSGCRIWAFDGTEVTEVGELIVDARRSCSFDENGVWLGDSFFLSGFDDSKYGTETSWRLSGNSGPDILTDEDGQSFDFSNAAAHDDGWVYFDHRSGELWRTDGENSERVLDTAWHELRLRSFDGRLYLNARGGPGSETYPSSDEGGIYEVTGDQIIPIFGPDKSLLLWGPESPLALVFESDSVAHQVTSQGTERLFAGKMSFAGWSHDRLFIRKLDEPGIFYFDPNASSVANEATPDPSMSGFSLKTFPNPVRERAVVELFVEAEVRLTLEIRDATGRLVETLHQGWVPAGKRRFGLDAIDLASGVYFLRAFGLDQSAATAIIVTKER